MGRNLTPHKLFLLILAISGVAAEKKDEERISSKERFVLKYMEAVSRLTPAERSQLKSEAEEYETLVDIGRNASFPEDCNAQCSPTRPTSVHELYPADIEVVAAIGDSVTAASGIDSIFIIGSLTQYRGSSWSVGGDGSILGSATEDPIVTIPNIINHFKDLASCGNNVKGFSELRGSESSDGARLNQAVIGATANELLAQAEELVNRINSTNRLNPDAGMRFDPAVAWKLLTLFVGGNDMCDYCDNRENKEVYSAENYGKNIEIVLDYLKANVKNMYVNIVPMFSITPINMVSKGRSCDVFQRLICSCGVDVSVKAEMNQLATRYYQALIDLVDTGKYDETDDFAVVLQSSFAEFAPLVNPVTGVVDKSLFAPDCFHPSRKGHELLAYILWNTMIKWPVGIKPSRYPIYNELDHCNRTGDCYKYACPQMDQYLWTRKNSNGTLDQFNVTTTTRRPTTTTTTTAAPPEEEDGDETTWIAMGAVIGVVGILTLIGIAYLFCKDKEEDEESFFA